MNACHRELDYAWRDLKSPSCDMSDVRLNEKRRKRMEDKAGSNVIYVMQFFLF